MQNVAHADNSEYQTLRGLMRYMQEETPGASMLAAALAEELTERQAQMVRLYYLEQHSMQEVAELLGINVSTVSRTLKSARTRLRRCLRYSSRALLHPEE